MLYNPKNFKCKHENLTKCKYGAKGLYECDDCNKQFVMIPAKNDPIIMPYYPKKPFRDPEDPDIPDFKRFDRKF